MYLILNLGLKSIRGIVFDKNGHQKYIKSFNINTLMLDEIIEQDANEWKTYFNKILLDIKENTSFSNLIKSVTVTTSSSCILGLGDHGKILTKVLMVSDKRSFKEVNEIKNDLNFQKLKNKPTCSTSSTIPKILWFKNNSNKIFNNVKYWIGAGEYLTYLLTGQLITDPLNAGKAFHNGSCYEKKVLKGLEINEETLPGVRKIGFKCSISDKIKKKYDFSPNINYVLTTYDAICAVLGSSDGKKETATDVSGTVTSIRIISEHNKQSENNSKTLLTQQIELINKAIIGSSNNLGGGIIEWYKQAFFNKNSDDVYFEMEEQAKKSITGAGGLLFLPYLLGERAPFMDLNTKGTFFGIGRNTMKSDFSKAVFESTAFVARDLLDSIRNNGNDVNKLVVSGGLARINLINQIKADVCNVPVYVLDNFESTSTGAFILMAVEIKLFNDYEDACNKIIRFKKVIKPNKSNNKYYESSFKLFKNINKNLSTFHNINKELNLLHLKNKVEMKVNL